MKTIIIIFALFVAAISAEQKSYRDYKAYLVTPGDIAEYELMKEWESVQGIDYWDGLKRKGDSRVMVSPEQQAQFESFLLFNRITHKLIVPDVEATLIEERARNARAWKSRKNVRTADGDFDRFWDLEEIYDYIEGLAVEFPSLVRVFDTETSHEGRPIKAIVISRDESANHPVMFIDGGIHAREWAAHMSVVYLIFQLVERSAMNADLLDNLDWVIIPVVNPDGFVFSMNTERFWRKNRRPIAGSQCFGVDNNRNFAYEWRSGSDPCSITYPGQSPLTEPENLAISNLMANYVGRIGVYLPTHTFGDMILWPYGWVMNRFVPNWQEHQTLGDEAAAGIRALTGSEMIVDNVATVLGISYGAGDDYGYVFGQARLAYTLELRGGGSGLSGFDLPADQMQEVAQETFVIYRVMGRYIAEL